MTRTISKVFGAVLLFSSLAGLLSGCYYDRYDRGYYSRRYDDRYDHRYSDRYYDRDYDRDWGPHHDWDHYND